MFGGVIQKIFGVGEFVKTHQWALKLNNICKQDLNKSKIRGVRGGSYADEYVSYMGKNAKEVNSYLEANPDIKQQIDNLSAQLIELLSES